MTEAMLSRVADNLYWMSRNLERAEHSVRLLNVHLDMMLDHTPVKAGERWAMILDSLLTPAPETVTDYAVMQQLICDLENVNSIVHCISTARENARHVRELLSSEMWEHLNTLYLQVRDTDLDTIWRDEPFNYLRAVENGLLLFQGVTDSTMNYGEGWHFIQAGRYIERAMSIAQLLNVHSRVLQQYGPEDAVQRYVEWVGILKSCTAFEAYVKIYSADIQPRLLIEFLLLNNAFPHAIGFSIGRLESALNAIAEATDKRRTIRVNKLSGRLQAMLGYATIDEIMDSGLENYLKDVRRQCAQIHDALQETYITYSIESAMDA